MALAYDPLSLNHAKSAKGHMSSVDLSVWGAGLLRPW